MAIQPLSTTLILQAFINTQNNVVGAISENIGIALNSGDWRKGEITLDGNALAMPLSIPLNASFILLLTPKVGDVIDRSTSATLATALPIVLTTSSGSLSLDSGGILVYADSFTGLTIANPNTLPVTITFLLG